MQLLPLLLSVCLFLSLGCDIDDIGPLNLDFDFLTVEVTTVGANLDSDGYMLSVTGEPEERIAVNDSRFYSVVTPRVTAELRDIAANCAAQANPQTIDVDGPTTLSFFVECF